MGYGMTLVYRIGWFGWRLVARLGLPLRVQMSIMFDSEAKVFVATTDDFLPELGLTVESETWQGIINEIHIALKEAGEICLGWADDKVKLKPVFILLDRC